MITIFTDGSCHPTNPGPGGFGVVVVDGNEIINTYSRQTDENTTNNREELKAILWTMINYGKNPEVVDVYSDSAYSINTLVDWKNSWKKRGWIKADKKTPENLDLVQAYDNLEELGYRINLLKIKGHNGHLYNELADKLARGEQI